MEGLAGHYKVFGFDSERRHLSKEGRELYFKGSLWWLCWEKNQGTRAEAETG